MKLLSVTLAAMASLIVASLVGSPAMAAGYLKIKEIPGEATAAAHRNAIAIDSVSHSGSRAKSATGSARQVSAASLSGVTVSKKIDKASPLLAEALTKGKVLPTASILMTRSNSNAAYYTIKLDNVRVEAMTTSASANGDTTETVTLGFEKITWVYVPSGSGGRPGAPVIKTYDVKAGR